MKTRILHDRNQFRISRSGCAAFLAALWILLTLACERPTDVETPSQAPTVAEPSLSNRPATSPSPSTLPESEPASPLRFEHMTAQSGVDMVYHGGPSSDRHMTEQNGGRLRQRWRHRPVRCGVSAESTLDEQRRRDLHGDDGRCGTSGRPVVDERRLGGPRPGRPARPVRRHLRRLVTGCPALFPPVDASREDLLSSARTCGPAGPPVSQPRRRNL